MATAKFNFYLHYNDYQASLKVKGVLKAALANDNFDTLNADILSVGEIGYVGVNFNDEYIARAAKGIEDSDNPQAWLQKIGQGTITPVWPSLNTMGHRPYIIKINDNVAKLLAPILVERYYEVAAKGKENKTTLKNLGRDVARFKTKSEKVNAPLIKLATDIKSGIRGFHVAHKANYAKACKITKPEITIGIYAGKNGDEGCIGEMQVKWIRLQLNRNSKSYLAPQLQCFDDAIGVLLSFQDVLSSIVLKDKKNYTPTDLIKVLKACGFRDLTNY